MCILYYLCVLFFQHHLVLSFIYDKPIVETIWQERCTSGQTEINDCNYCVCDSDSDNTFICTARVCDGVDTSGHFKDTIKQYIVGREGHGALRTTDTACQPRMHYIRHELLCVCNDDGFWPNPVCRDQLRVMYEVKPNTSSFFLPGQLSGLQCTPFTLILLKPCLICLCGPNERIVDCMNYNCTNEDPILTPVDKLKATEKKYVPIVFYAACDVRKEYKIGCRSCKCIRNNRLLCDHCDRSYGFNIPNFLSTKTQYLDTPTKNCTMGEILLNACNYCHCVQSRDFNIPSMPVRGVFICVVRSICHRSDLVGHFDDPLRDYIIANFGAQIQGQTASGLRMCEPHVQYQRSGMTCVCNDNGEWPSESCREVFQILYKVKKRMTTSIPTAEGDNFQCTPLDVYTFNCDMCVCSPQGNITIEGCVHSACFKNDSIFLDMPKFLKQDQKFDVTAFYVECTVKKLYTFGCRRCICLESNRLLCDNCNKEFGMSLPFFNWKVPGRIELPSANCTTNQRIMNDCNWCLCDKDKRFVCSIRECHGGNRFGEFKDLIREFKTRTVTISRSEDTDCQPQVHYQREGLVCVCTDDGDWPSSTCGEEFGELFEVMDAGGSRHRCTENRFYLHGCNLCLCSLGGFVDPNYCTHYECSIENSFQKDIGVIQKDYNKVYADCEPDKLYRLGCKNCYCLKENRLVCDNCEHKAIDNICLNNEVGKVFNIECNLCVCDEKGIINCTTKQCHKDSSDLEELESLTSEGPLIESSRLKYEPLKIKLTMMKGQDMTSCHKNHIYEVGCSICLCLKNGNLLCKIVECK